MWKLKVLETRSHASGLFEIETIWSTGTYDSFEEVVKTVLEEVNLFEDTSISMVLAKEDDNHWQVIWNRPAMRPQNVVAYIAGVAVKIPDRVFPRENLRVKTVNDGVAGAVSELAFFYEPPEEGIRLGTGFTTSMVYQQARVAMLALMLGLWDIAPKVVPPKHNTNVRFRDLDGEWKTV